VASSPRRHLTGEADEPWVRQCLPGGVPVVAATDYVRAFAEQVRPYLEGTPYAVLGTDGYGRSDFRRKLRSFFEVDRRHVALAVLRTLGEDDAAKQAIEKYEIDVEAEAPWRR
jgi:pyruvate dehydrogenase E1 component